MTATTQTTQFDWMKDVGVPAIDVHWLKTIAGSPKRNHPVAARRVKEIQDLAFNGILAQTKTFVPTALMS